MQDLQVLPQAVAVHDISGFGKCALTVAIPVLSACGVEVCPLPTAVFSANTEFPNFQMHDLTDHIPRMLHHWKDLGLNPAALYTGFLGSEAQISLIEEAVSLFSPGLVVIDPVCGDQGQLYKTYSPAMCDRLKNLARIATVITPNLTEACVLTGTDYARADTSPAGIRAMAQVLCDMGAQAVVITGIERGQTLYNCILDRAGYREHPHPLLPFRMHGTGDLFASVLTGGMMTGHSLDESVDSAAGFVSFIMEKSLHFADYERRGVCFEPWLGALTGGLFCNKEV